MTTGAPQSPSPALTPTALASTGADEAVSAGAGVSALTAGIVLVLAGRRRAPKRRH